MRSGSAWALIVAAGRSERMGTDKLRARLGGVPVIVRTLRAFTSAKSEGILEGIVIAGPRDAYVDLCDFLASWEIKETVVPGGDTRQESVRCGLRALPEGCIALVHDGARPLVSAELVRDCVESARAFGSGVAAVGVTDSLHRVTDGRIIPIDREGVYAAQTPQAFARDVLLEALARADASGMRVTDEASAMAMMGCDVRFVPSPLANMKITVKEDLRRAEAFLPGPRQQVGYGYDVHRLGPGGGLILCGVKIACERALIGHSDADVAAHALIDALLGAAGMEDIGARFSDSDPAFKGISSIELLRRAYADLLDRGGEISSADLTIVAERPKLSPYRDTMRETLATALRTEARQVNVKFKTTEGLGFEGRGEGISAHAVACVRLWDNASLA